MLASNVIAACALVPTPADSLRLKCSSVRRLQSSGPFINMLYNWCMQQSRTIEEHDKRQSINLSSVPRRHLTSCDSSLDTPKTKAYGILKGRRSKVDGYLGQFGEPRVALGNTV